jgi:hypothetical protein
MQLEVVFTVTAIDNGIPFPLNGTAIVNITVTPQDNFVTPILDQTDYIATLDENSPVGSPVLQFTITDTDIGSASEIGQIIILGDDSQFFTTEQTGPKSGVIRSK